ncbi:MAG TPA: threonine aldolase family protein, partial [Geminicoccaceae bacterium]|nr:threonine aldolase family protein [Geminicoccaceae bacterium]
MPDVRINLYSDTQTRPTPAMRRAMAEAPVGDEQRGEDPTVNRLCAMVAGLLGKEAAVFLPSGTMCNEIAILVHCQRGDEIIADRTAHVITAEGGGPAALAGALVNPLDGAAGVFTAEQARAAVRARSRYSPRTRVIVVEQTSNFGGGTVWPLAGIRAVAEVAGEHGLALHMDGARLMNAVVASNAAAREHALPFDSAWLDLSKGLGCPVGAVLAGSADFIEAAWRWKQRIGGAMRQAGIIAAAGVFALEHHVARLAEDHANARAFAGRIAGVPGILVEPERVQTNIVFFDVAGTGLGAPEIA